MKNVLIYVSEKSNKKVGPNHVDHLAIVPYGF